MINPESGRAGEALPTEEAGAKTEEDRDKQAKRLVAFLDKINTEEVFGDEEKRKEYIKNLDFDDFKDLLIRVNGIVRDIPITKRKFNGTNVKLMGAGGYVGYVPPFHEDKEPLLKEAFTKAKGSGDIKNTALLISVAVNAIHPFADGNGRTSRLVYRLIGEGYRGSEEEKAKLSKILGEKGRVGLDIEPTIIEAQILNIVKKEETGLDSANPNDPMGMWDEDRNGELKFKGDVSKEDESHFGEMAGTRKDAMLSPYGLIAIYKYLKDAGRLDKKYFKTFFKDDGEPVRTRMLTNIVAEDLTSKDIKGIADVYWDIKRKYIRKLVDVISNPEEYPSDDKSGGTLKDYFKSRVEW